jgi:tetratricopeptide (TPR) repeat protein
MAKEDVDGATTDFDRAIELDPKDATAHSNRGAARFRKDDVKGAIADTSRAIELDPQPADTWNNRGVMRRDSGDLDGAITDFSQAVKLAPDYADAWANLATVRAAKGDSAGTITAIDRVIELRPDSGKAYHYRGVARYMSGAWGAAAEDFDVAVRLDKTMEGSAPLFSCAALIRSGPDPAAEKKLQAWLDKRGAGASAGWPSAAGRFLLGADDEKTLVSAAEAFAKKEESGQLAQAWYFAGIRHLASGDKAGAAERFRKCVAAEPKRAIVQSFAAAELGWLGEK